ncbi:MAG: energy-coupling factor transporter ATP-binding protein EcfA2 [Planctomycetota bacterium]|jgi:energy-coupling factor transporter ATP-binding protein EcfA2
MRTLLRNFSEEFVTTLRTLLQPLDDAAEKLSWTGDDFPGKDVLPDLREVRHQLGALVDKVADQHAFVLIFGPLKSGKSTLMNALSAAYVSEVSSLPAYPAMVYVSDSPTRSFTVTRYHGGTETLGDTASLQMQIQRAHSELIGALRKAEDEGRADEFDPATDFPQAVRRIDVRVPAGDLEASGAVLVDTPGLYSRMKFGYDRMTREFRNAAACAIFVVKSDNLFLEQVFNEFNQLLGLFSRIFLVVNVDTSKRDVGPNGELIPSLEQKNPLGVIEAFQNYAMSAPLKRAADEGRLAIYPIDLLQAASARLKGEAVEDDSGQFKGRASFDVFQKDLADYLNSTDYLVAFVNDSLRRAEMLTSDIDDINRRPGVEQLRQRVRDLEEQLRDKHERLSAVGDLESYDWEHAFIGFEDRLASIFRDRARGAEERTSESLDQSLEDWFENDASLQSLLEDELAPSLEEHRDELARFLHDTLSQEASASVGGLEVEEEIKELLSVAGLDTELLARDALAGAKARVQMGQTRKPFQAQDIPVRKKVFWDWILFRSQATMSRLMFGPTEHPSVRISVSVKNTRLGDPAREALSQAIDRHKGEFFPSATETVRRGFLATYTRRLSDAMREALLDRRRTLGEEETSLRTGLDESQEILALLNQVKDLGAASRRDVEDLRRRHGDGESPDLMDVVIEPPAPVRELEEIE